MLGSLGPVATAALRGSYGPGSAAPSSARPIAPVVRSTYSPSPPAGTQNTLYNRTGGLNNAAYQAASQSVSYQRNDTFDLSIETADGDIATISISQQQSWASSLEAVSTAGRAGQANVQALSINSSDALEVNISVEGELSAEETAAINALVNQVNGVAEDFFAGDMEQATQAARQIRFSPDDSTLSAYQFSLQSQESLRAVAVYESLANATDLRVAVSSAAEPKADFLQSLRAMLEDLARSSKILSA